MAGNPISSRLRKVAPEEVIVLEVSYPKTIPSHPSTLSQSPSLPVRPGLPHVFHETRLEPFFPFSSPCSPVSRIGTVGNFDRLPGLFFLSPFSTSVKVLEVAEARKTVAGF